MAAQVDNGQAKSGNLQGNAQLEMQADYRFTGEAARLSRQQSAAEANQNFGLGGSAYSQLKGEVKLTMANSVGLFETQDMKARKSQEVTSGLSGGTASNSKLQPSPTHQVRGTSNGALGATSHQTFNQTQQMQLSIDRRPSQENLSLRGLEIASSKKMPLSPLRVVVSSTAKIPGRGPQSGEPDTFTGQANMLKVQNIIDMQGKQAAIADIQRIHQLHHIHMQEHYWRST